ncbi:MvdC/MvdD family ATP grasp protein [Streptomyces sp. NPDC007206]|uniref:MvdC/MvdD family ATP grasp protein n=1 Tax=Streptomyces sp. NPDC007206 TaxID=3154317 RepID=UPI0033F23240
MPAVLVIAARDDWPTDRVIEALIDGGVEVFRMDTAEFPMDLTLAGRIDAGRGWFGGLATALRAVDVAGIAAVYYRAPDAFVLPPTMSGPERHFAAAQARSGLGGIISALDCRWVSHPAAMSRAEYKPLQLATARACSLVIPPTLITNRADAVRGFVDEVGGRVIGKTVRALVRAGREEASA